MSNCSMCGQCCRMIHLSRHEHYRIQVYVNKKDCPDRYFIKKNWEYIGMSDEIEGGMYYPNNGSIVKFAVYKCKLITADNKCSIHKYKPRVCSGYPYYEQGKGGDSMPWGYKGCSYERDLYELSLLKALRQFRDSLLSDSLLSDRKAVEVVEDSLGIN